MVLETKAVVFNVTANTHARTHEHTPAHAHTLDCNSTRHSEALYRMELTLGIQLY